MRRGDRLAGARILSAAAQESHPGDSTAMAGSRLYRVNARGRALEDISAASPDRADRPIAWRSSRPAHRRRPELGARFLERLRLRLRPAPGPRRSPRASGDEPRSGIRQVELVTQLFQLAHGASTRRCGLRARWGRSTRWSRRPGARAAQQELAHAFVFLRSVEQRLQLANEHQTGLGSDENLGQADEGVTQTRRRDVRLPPSKLHERAMIDITGIGADSIDHVLRIPGDAASLVSSGKTADQQPGVALRRADGHGDVRLRGPGASRPLHRCVRCGRARAAHSCGTGRPRRGRPCCRRQRRPVRVR